MGQSSEWAIELHNERIAADERYAADYEENMRIDAALEAEFFEQEMENEKQVDWFSDKRITHTGAPLELELEPQPEAAFVKDSDLPF